MRPYNFSAGPAVMPDEVLQQAALDMWRRTFNEERPHAALGMSVPNALYQHSPRRFDPSPIELVLMVRGCRPASRSGRSSAAVFMP